MAVGDRFKKFDLAKLRTYEKYDEAAIESPAYRVSPIVKENGWNRNIFAELQNLLLEKVENIPVWFEYSNEKQKELVESFFDNKIKNYPECTFSEVEREKVVEDLYKSISGFGKLDYLLQQDNISMVLVNGHNVLIEISGKVLNADTKLNDKQISFLLKNIFRNVDIEASKEPIVNCMVDGFLITVIKQPVCTNAISITIRKQPKKLGYGELIHTKFMPKDIAEFLMMVVQGRKNVIITGVQSTGKSFLADSILTASLNNSRVAVIEDFPSFSSKNEKFSNFSTKSLSDLNDFRLFWNAVVKTAPEYIVADIKNLDFSASILDYVLTSNGNILVMSGISAEHVYTKSVGLLQGLGYSEKLAKAEFLRAIDYIITLEKTDDLTCRVCSVTEVNNAKNIAQCLRDIYNVNSNLIIKNEELDNIKTDTSSIKARFAQI